MSKKQRLLEHMNTDDDSSWEDHSEWAKRVLDWEITPEECAELYIDYLFG
jgi:hypothetical protein